MILLRGMDASVDSTRHQHSSTLLVAETTVLERQRIKERINLLMTTISSRKGRDCYDGYWSGMNKEVCSVLILSVRSYSDFDW